MPVRSVRFTAVIHRLLTVLLLVLAMGGPLFAQDDARPRLDAIKLELGQIEATLQREDLKEDALQALRMRIDPVQDQLRAIIMAGTPRLEAAKNRLDQLGPPPDPAKGGSESADVSKERADLEKFKTEVDDVVRLARLLSVQADQLQVRISERRRAVFTRELFRRSYSIVSPVLWVEVAQAMPREIQSLRIFAGNSLTQLASNIDAARLGLIALVLAGAGLGGVLLSRFMRRFDRATIEDAEPSKRRRAIAAMRMLLIRFVLCIGLAIAATGFVDALGLASGSLQDVINTIIWSVALVILAGGLAKAALSPEAPHWRLFGDDELAVEKLSALGFRLPAIIATGRVLEAIGQAVVAPLPVTVLTKGLVATLVALTTIKTLRLMQSPATLEEAEAPGFPKAAVETKLPFRLIVAMVAFLVLIAALLGYIALASFVVSQLVWVVSVSTALAMLLVLIDEIVSYELSSQGRLGRMVQSTVGVRAGSLQQVGILSAGALRLALWIIAIFLMLAPWGIDGTDAASTLRAAFFGFSIGGVTISLSTIVITLALFFGGVLITRSIKGWLEEKYLPHTGLDPGLQNSIGTILGYCGVLATALLALGQLGLSLEKLAIVAGALSVGIGFGLQSIANNFVSGLILLWERPIKVGDWISVGQDQGIVRRINVRATEIDTFDRASLIVPNSEFISGKLKNFVHADRIGRILIPVGVAYGADPQAVEKILTEVALSHREVLSEPRPRVFFVKLAESTLDFELICYVDVGGLGSVKSDLLFEIVRRFGEAGIEIPFPRRTIEITNLDRLSEAVTRIADSNDKPTKAEPT